MSQDIFGSPESPPPDRNTAPRWWERGLAQGAALGILTTLAGAQGISAPTLTITDPVPMGDTGVALLESVDNDAVIMGVSFGSGSTVLPWGVVEIAYPPICTRFDVIPPGGVLEIPFGIGCNPAFSGLTLHAQYAAVDLVGSLGVRFSNADTVTIIPPLAFADDFNLFVIGDAVMSSTDVEGRVAVGGDAVFSNFAVGEALIPSGGARDDLLVGGDISFTDGTVYSGNLVHGGNATLVNVTLPSGSVMQSAVQDFLVTEAILKKRSGLWADMPPTGDVKLEWGILSLDGDDKAVNLFEVDGADLDAANTLQLTVPAGSNCLINVSGADCKAMFMGITLTGVAAADVLFNFHEASLLTVEGIGIPGSILAPYAHTVFNSGAITGQVLCRSLQGGGQINLGLFDVCATLP